MRQWTRRRPSPALVISLIALFAAMGGTVYAAKRAKINGGAIRVKSLPGNRLKPRSIPANRLKPGVLSASPAAGAPGVVTGLEVDEMSLGQVPEAAHADHADTAQSAVDAETALNAVNAVTASKVNGYEAGCVPGTELFAGECWEMSASNTALQAPAAAQSCAAKGGQLPEALQLAAYSQQRTLDAGDEWSNDIPVFSGLNTYGVLTVSAAGQLNSVNSATPKKFRCVFPLLH
ncbi:MAG TPA: hypothetical protein VF176_01320 [Solirubrobacterales bacterium]